MLTGRLRPRPVGHLNQLFRGGDIGLAWPGHVPCAHRPLDTELGRPTACQGSRRSLLTAAAVVTAPSAARIA
jgi:hypothetical protein